jgi:putative transcriptional regulator
MSVELLGKTEMTVQWRLKIIMAIRDVSNEDLSKKTGLHTGTISKLRNKTPERIELSTLEKLCKGLNCSLTDLMVITDDAA